MGGKNVIDVGLGTGRESIQLASMGARVCGIDTSIGMLRVADYKIRERGLGATLVRADAQFLPFKNGIFDMVICFGSILNYVANFRQALSEFARTSRSDSSVAVGIDNALNLDLFWIFVDSVVGGRLGYKLPIRHVLSRFITSENGVPYPYKLPDGSIDYTFQRFLRLRDVASCLRENEFSAVRYYGIHTATGLLPTTWTVNSSGPAWIARMTSTLSKFDKSVMTLSGVNRFAYHVILVGRRH